MKFADINKKFSEAVAEKLANGFQICCNTMSGAIRKMVAKFYRRHKSIWQKEKIAAVDIEKVDFRRNGNDRTITIYHSKGKAEVNF